MFLALKEWHLCFPAVGCHCELFCARERLVQLYNDNEQVIPLQVAPTTT